MRIPRTRGAVSGLLLVILGAWGALLPLVGPSLHFATSPDRSWDLTTGRLLLEVAPGIAVVLGGIVLLVSALRPSAGLGAWLALAGGVWFVIGSPISTLWNHGVSQAGTPLGTGSGHRTLELLLSFTGLGAAIVALSAFALGRLSVRSVRDVALARERDAAAVDAAPAGEPAIAPGRRFARRPAATGAETRVAEPVAAGGATGRTAVVERDGAFDADRRAPDPAAAQAADRPGLLDRLREGRSGREDV